MNMSSSTQTRATPLELFGRRRELHRLLLGLVAFVTISNGIVSWHLASKIGSTPQVLLMDESTYYLPKKSADFADAKELHVSQAGLAMEALFDRGPNGLDHPDRLKLITDKAGYQEAMKLIETDADAFEAKKIHQKFELRSVELIQVENGSFLIAVEGQLLRTGNFNGGGFSEGLSVKARLLFVRNSSMVINGAYPTRLRSLHTKITPISIP